MKVWMVFLLATFVLGGWEFRHQRTAKFVVLFGICVVAALAFRSYRFV
jgi:hypothetical protein